MNIGNRLLRLALGLASIVGAIFGWADVMKPILETAPGNPPLRVLGRLLDPSGPHRFWGENYLFILLLVAAALVVIAVIGAIGQYFENAQVGITVLYTHLDLEMLDDECHRARLHRQQAFHANRGGITAYNLTHVAEAPNGRIPKGSIELKSIVGGEIITQELLQRGNEKRIEIIELYRRPLPTSLFATYLPNWVVSLLHQGPFFRSVVVERGGRVEYVDEYNVAEPVVSVTSARYPVSDVRLTVKFREGSEPALADIRGLLIQENAVQSVPIVPSSDDGRVIYSARIQRMSRASLRVQWTNRRAVEHGAGAPAPPS